MKQGDFEIPAWGWIIFGAVVVVLLGIDHVAHRGERAESRKVALLWSMIWIAAGLGFNVFVYFALGTRAAAEYLATYVIEKALSTDNIPPLFSVAFTIAVIGSTIWLSLKRGGDAREKSRLAAGEEKP